jgi:hypothetical protein
VLRWMPRDPKDAIVAAAASMVRKNTGQDVAIASQIDSQFASRACVVSRGRASFSEQ